MALICRMTLSMQRIVGWHDCSCEEWEWSHLEESSEQILEVVASLICTCEGGFILCIEGSDTILSKGRKLNITSNLPGVVTQQRPRRATQCQFAVYTELWNVMLRRSSRRVLKMQGSCRTEPHQDFRVSSPKCK